MTIGIAEQIAIKMKYNPTEIEKKWQNEWAIKKPFAAENNSDKPKYYVLDMFPYPSGAGLHVGHPLGYIASDIVARYKRHKGFNVLHPQGYDSFGLPAEQYAIQTGQHPDKTTKENIARYREQLDRIGFSFDWNRQVITSNADYYKHTQWIFIQLFNSWYNKNTDKAEDISTLISTFEKDGNQTINAVCDDNIIDFSANDWNSFSDIEKQKILLQYRLTYLAETEVNWCAALGTVLANDEIVNGVSERGGHPVIRKKMTQWSMRISAYAERLLTGLDTIDWSESIKESQRNWIGKSVGASVKFRILPPTPSEGGGAATKMDVVIANKTPRFMTGSPENAANLLVYAKEMRKEPTLEEALLWDELRRKKIEERFRRQHLIGNYIVDFVCLEKRLIVEVDGGYHNSKEQKELDDLRTLELEQKYFFKVIRFTNEQVKKEISTVLSKIKDELISRKTVQNENLTQDIHTSPPPPLEGVGGRNQNIHHSSPPPSDRFVEGIEVFTTRPDTLFGVTFLTLAPEHDLVQEITTADQKQAVEKYIEATAKRSERERMADVKTISGVFTGAYAEHPFTKEPIPVWIGDYVLAGYGTGAVMAVPAGDERDFAFAKHFNLPIKNIFSVAGSPPSEGLGEDFAFTEKSNFILENSDFLNGLNYKEATKKIITELEAIGQGKGKTNYRLRDAVFSRQRYWGEPFPVYYVDGLPQMIDPKYLPIKLPEVEKYLPTEDGLPPLGNAKAWHWDTNKNEVVSVVDAAKPPSGVWGLELNTMPGWAGSSWYWMRYMDAHNENEFCSQDALKYWQNVDLYIGGSEHATGHLLYSRFWNKFLKDKGFAPTEEPFKKLINQGMILGMSAYAYGVSYSIDHVTMSGNMDEEYESIITPKVDFVQINFYKMYNKILDGLIALNFSKYLKNKLFFDSSWATEILEIYDENLVVDNDSKIICNLDIKIIDNLRVIEKFLLKFLVKVKDLNKTNKFNINFSLRGHNDGNVKIGFFPILIDLFVINDSTNELNIEKFKNHPLYSDYKDAEFILDENGKYIVGREVEKMSKSKYNVVNPDDICNEYGADTLRLYEMFLGPLEQSKPWNTAGISGVFGFLKKLWRLYFNDVDFIVTDNEPSKESLKSLHKTIKKCTEDIENFSFNTSVSQFMICVNELTAQNCHERAILEPLAILISPYAPHIAEELWCKLTSPNPSEGGEKEGISFQPFPIYDEKYLIESDKEYPVSFNGKMRFTINLPLDLTVPQIEAIIMKDERTIKQLDGSVPKKVIIVPGKVINLVG